MFTKDKFGRKHRCMNCCLLSEIVQMNLAKEKQQVLAILETLYEHLCLCSYSSLHLGFYFVFCFFCKGESMILEFLGLNLAKFWIGFLVPKFQQK